MLSQKLVLSAAGAAAADRIYVDDVFSTFLYDGNNTGQTITNGIDLSGEGGMVWIKGRSNSTSSMIWDTERGVRKYLSTNSDAGESTSSGAGSGYGLTAFNSNGFTLGGNWNTENFSSYTYCSWTFRKCPGFFDVVTYTGNDVNGRTISHNLGSVPGSIWIKRTDSTDNWLVYHRGMDSTAPEDYYMFLHSSDGRGDLNYFADTAPTASVFSVQGYTEVNGSGNSYVAFIFAHDDQSFGEDGNEAIIKCGSFTASDGSPHTVTVGFEPQWVIIKRTTNIGDWTILDNMRGWVADTSSDSTVRLIANSSNAEEGVADMSGLTSTGFTVDDGGITYGSNQDYIYIAIRRPHKPPETAAECLDVFEVNGSNSTTIRSGTSGSSVTDLAWIKRVNATNNWIAGARLLGLQSLRLNGTDDAATSVFGHPVTNAWDVMQGMRLASDSDTSSANDPFVNLFFARKPGFLDVITYTGDANNNRSLAHNLKAVPEFMIGKRVSSPAKTWITYHKNFGYTKALELNTTLPQSDNVWGATPTSTALTIDSNSAINTDGADYVIYLFASLPGISKVGSYTGASSTVDVDCGFTNGARLVIIKNISTDGRDWGVFNTATGLVSGNDSYLRLNSNAAEITSQDYIDPLSSGFSIPSSAPLFNVSGDTYIFLAIA